MYQGTTLRRSVAGDFNGDGKMDVAFVNAPPGGTFLSSSPSTLTVLLSNGDGTFTTKISNLPLTDFPPMAAGDFNGDGKLDLALQNGTVGGITILLGNGDGTFTEEETIPVGRAAFGEIAVGRFNNDGKAETVPAIVNLSTTRSTGITVNRQVNATISVPTLDNFAPTGTVSLYQGSTLVKTTSLTNGTVTVPMSFATAGQVLLTAYYDGDSNLGASSTSLTIQVSNAQN